MEPKKVQEMTEAELDLHIDLLKSKLILEQKHHQKLLHQLQAIKQRRIQFTAQTDRNEIERIQKLIKNL